MASRGIDRRMFLRTSAAVAAAPFFAPAVVRAGAIDKLNIAVVGVGGRGAGNIDGIQHENIVALCDVDANNLGVMAKRFPGAGTYRDFRVMLEKQADIDAVLVSTPDHTHAPVALMALRMGKHVYCEKPLAHTVHECRLMARLAAEKGVATQMGTQIHAGANYRRVVELIRGGAIGPVRHAYVWCGKSWSNGRYRPAGDPPATLDWDLWLGPAADRAYAPNLHPANWRRYWDFGTGTLGDMACHYMDLVHWALDLRNPVRVRTVGPHPHPVGTPDGLVVHYDHPSRSDMPPVKVSWYDGANRPSILRALRGADGAPLNWGDGQLFVGDRGMLISDYGRHLLLPTGAFADFEVPAPTIADSIGHHREWIEACKTGSPTTCNFDYSGALAETVLLGNVAFRAGTPIEWDSAALRVTNSTEADAMIRKTYRPGWEL
ncbi:MAG: Gfo/Idh/MocA family protein [Planctomycetota bacterium]